MQLIQRESLTVPEAQREAFDSVKIGAELYGYCGGYFGCDSYGIKVVVSKTTKELVVRENGRTLTASVPNWNDLVESSNRWLEEHPEVYQD